MQISIELKTRRSNRAYVLQPYYNRADSHQYAADKRTPESLQNTCKSA
jgi:hypothetical protein